MAEGVVARFFPDKGFGFIQRGSTEPDVFLHVAQLVGAERAVKVGDRVRFDLAAGARGDRAVNVSILERAADTVGNV